MEQSCVEKQLDGSFLENVLDTEEQSLSEHSLEDVCLHTLHYILSATLSRAPGQPTAYLVQSRKSPLSVDLLEHVQCVRISLFLLLYRSCSASCQDSRILLMIIFCLKTDFRQDVRESNDRCDRLGHGSQDEGFSRCHFRAFAKYERLQSLEGAVCKGGVLAFAVLYVNGS